MKRSTWIAYMAAATTAVNAQTVTLDGYAFEKYNRGFLNEVKVTAFDASQTLIGEVITTQDGHFQLKVPAGKVYFLSSEKRVFLTRQDTISTVGIKSDETVYLKFELERQPGYLFDAKIANKRSDNYTPTDAIGAARIEIYNNTTKKPELVIDKHTSPFFSFTLQQGNHYTILVRKEGYFNKRMEAHVNIDGCILCFEGIGTVSPGVSDNLSSIENRKVGSLNANIEMEHIDTTRNMVIQNIYYGLGSADLTEAAKGELDKIGLVLKNNPQLVVELGSHTDSRGNEDANKLLSEQRAKAAVDYIIAKSGIDRNKLKAKGYGESRPVNECEDGTPCSEDKHRQNRRTELKITGFTLNKFQDMSLAEIIHEEELEKFINSTETFQSVEYKAPTNPTPAPNNLIADHTPKKVEVLESKGAAATKTVAETAKTEAREAVAAGAIPRNGNNEDKPKTDGAKNAVQKGEKNVKETVKKGEPIVKEVKETGKTAVKDAKETGKTAVKDAKETGKAAVKEVKETNKATAKDAKNASKTVVNEAKTEVKDLKTAKVGRPADDFDETVVKPVSVTKPQVGTIPEMKRPNRDTTPQPVLKTFDPNEPPFQAPQRQRFETTTKKDVLYAIFPIQADYSGYRILFLSSPTELKKEDERLKAAADVMTAIYMLKTATGFEYYLGDVQHWNEAERFFTKVKETFPKAEMIEFFKGKKL
jgi:outer membrane protein OmpA-like peptidoglycan-associated protein